VAADVAALVELVDAEAPLEPRAKPANADRVKRMSCLRRLRQQPAMRQRLRRQRRQRRGGRSPKSDPMV
jgi:hypothetical protein